MFKSRKEEQIVGFRAEVRGRKDSGSQKQPLEALEFVIPGRKGTSL